MAEELKIEKGEDGKYYREVMKLEEVDMDVIKENYEAANNKYNENNKQIAEAEEIIAECEKSNEYIIPNLSQVRNILIEEGIIDLNDEPKDENTEETEE